MTPRACASVLSALLLVFSADALVPGGEPPAKVLVDVAGVSLDSAPSHGLKAAIVQGTRGPRLRLESGHRDPWPGIGFAARKGGWDLSGYGDVSVEVCNVGSGVARVGLRVDGPAADGKPAWIQETAELKPAEAATLRVPLRRKMSEALAAKFFGMRGYPGGLSEKAGVDTSRVIEVRVFVARPVADHVLEVGSIVAGGRPRHPLPADPARWFPMIDRYGQYMHSDWPRKTRSDDDLARRRQEEAADLAAHPGPEDWSRFGGWQAGPPQKATGFFRVEKVQGKWWLVDPEGRLFWSHGIDCVRPNTAVTPISDREFWFADLPPRDSPLAFYGSGAWAPHGYYMGKKYRTFSFSEANLLRKYGSDWQAEFGPLVHRRLRSWGLNTIANWSDEKIFLQRKTPYVVSIHTQFPALEGSTGYWGKFPDVFAPAFRQRLRESLAKQKGASAGDPWCLGYFIGNELAWGEELSLAQAALASPAAQPAKQVLVADLKRKYNAIEALNRVWGTRYASWQALADAREPADKKKAYDDLAAFATKTAEQFFRLCREAVKEVAPHQLYLGCRFAWVNDRAVQAAAKFCDVIGYNLYRYSIEDFRLPEGLDCPVVVGEFHFGALDRGMLHTGLRPVESQAERAKAYENYVNGAIGNPLIVGTHWFQYADQATTGRGDGENYQIGFVDVCDTPYPETIEASRRVGTTMYRRRLGQ